VASFVLLPTFTSSRCTLHRIVPGDRSLQADVNGNSAATRTSIMVLVISTILIWMSEIPVPRRHKPSACRASLSESLLWRWEGSGHSSAVMIQKNRMDPAYIALVAACRSFCSSCWCQAIDSPGPMDRYSPWGVISCIRR
jgi:hypothetical protein